MTRFRRIAAVLAAAATAGVLALVPVLAGASTGTGNIYSSNGEAGYYTWSATAFNENYAYVTPTAVAEQMGANGGVGLQLGALSTNNVYQQSVGQKCSVAQIGLVWNNGEKAFDVIAAEGTIQYEPANSTDNGSTNPDACTTGGSLSDASVIAGAPGAQETPGTLVHQDGYDVTTQYAEKIIAGVPAGDQVYLNELRVGNGAIKFTAYDNNKTFNFGEDTLGNHVFSGSLQPHFAGAGTVFDLTNRSPAAQTAADQEASFYLLRAGQWLKSHGHFATVTNIYNTWLAQQVQSSANGEPSDPPAVTPFNTLNHPYGGIFALYVGTPVGA